MGAKPEQVRNRLVTTLALSSAVSLALLGGRILATGSHTYWFLGWNLLLAWLPIGFAWWLLARLANSRWSNPGNIALTLLWLAFLPNAFYIASDTIHLTDSGNISVLYDAVMFLSFTFNGFILGYVSLFGIHNQLRKRFNATLAWWWVAGVLLLCSFAIYLGRYLRWNSWDIVVNPAGLIFDVSEPFINPTNHPQVFTTTLMFFVLLSSIYVVGYRLVKLAKDSPN